MGCSQSKLDDEEAVQICKDRKRFIKQAVEQRTRFACGHVAYIQSLKRVSAALREYIEGDEPHEFSMDSYVTPPFTPVKKSNQDNSFISISPGSFSPSRKKIQSKPKSKLKLNYMMSSGSQAVSVEETLPPAEMFRVETCYGTDGFFPTNSSSFWGRMDSPEIRPSNNIPPPSPQNSQWDFFWNPFSSLDYYGYTAGRGSLDPTGRSSLDPTVVDDDIRGLRRVREEEGIPELEDDETENEATVTKNTSTEEGRAKKVEVFNCCSEEVTVEDVDEDEDDEEMTDSGEETDSSDGKVSETQQRQSVEVSRQQNMGRVEVGNRETAVGVREDAKGETPGYTVYVNRRPTSMAEVIKDLDDQFTVICNAAAEVSGLLEAGRAKYSTSSNELTAMKMLNPVALFRSGSSRSSSSRFFVSSSSSRDNGYESSSDRSDESGMFSGSHQSMLDRLYAWEKKLYDEVRAGEKVRIAYEKKCMQLRNQDVKGEDPVAVDKTRAVIRDLHTQIKVSIHSIEAISKRIETLRDEELQPQLLELIQGLTRMWKVMGECHQIQKRTLDEAKLLLAGTPSKLEKKRRSSLPPVDPLQLARSASNLETELRNWRTCFETWITSQRSYMHSLAAWLLRCFRCDPDPNLSNLPFSPRRSSSGGTQTQVPLYGICVQWSRFLGSLNEKPVLDGLDFFAAGMGSIYAQQLKEDATRFGSRRYGTGSDGMEIVEMGHVEDVMTAEKTAEVAVRVLCAGMSVAMSSMAEFAIGSADGYSKLVSQWETATSIPGGPEDIKV